MLDILGTGAELSSQHLAARRFPMNIICKWANPVIDGETGKLLEYRHLIKRPKYRKKWAISLWNEIGQLCQGIEGRAVGTGTVFSSMKAKCQKIMSKM